MPIYQAAFTVETREPGLWEITQNVAREVQRSRVDCGVATIFCQHTSCSLVIMENADPSARRDLVAWMNRLVPDEEANFTHTLEGPDDMPSHIKMALTRTSESIPIGGGVLLLGTWQGVFLWEHRRAAHARRIVVTVIGEARNSSIPGKS